MTNVGKAVRSVAGLGPRVLAGVKALLDDARPAVDPTQISYAVEAARETGQRELSFITSRCTGTRGDHIDRAGIRPTIPARTVTAVRPPAPLGLGRAVWYARHAVGDGPFAGIGSDDLIQTRALGLHQPVGAHAETGSNTAAVIEVLPDQVQGCGVLDVTGDEGRRAVAHGAAEKPDPRSAPSTIPLIARHIPDPRVTGEPDRESPEDGGEVQLTDASAPPWRDAGPNRTRFAGTRFDSADTASHVAATLALALAGPDTRPRTFGLIRAYASNPPQHPRRTGSRRPNRGSPPAGSCPPTPGAGGRHRDIGTATRVRGAWAFAARSTRRQAPTRRPGRWPRHQNNPCGGSVGNANSGASYGTAAMSVQSCGTSPSIDCARRTGVNLAGAAPERSSPESTPTRSPLDPG